MSGRVEIETESSQELVGAEAWLVDNHEGPGDTVLPEPEDRRVRLGRLEGGADFLTLVADLGAGFFDDFETDQVVVSLPGEDPMQSRLIVGLPSLFQRTYVRMRNGSFPPGDGPPASRRLLATLGAFGTQPAFATHVVPTFDPLIEEGAETFFEETFGGNGRTCGTCHPAENNFTIDPEFIGTLPPNDPLFVAEFDPALATLERPELMRKVGLILENVDGTDDLANKFVLRGVPHTLGLVLSIAGDGGAPSQRTGWDGNGSPAGGTLRGFALGAVHQHFPKSLNRIAGVDFRMPSNGELDSLEAFQLFLGRDAELDLSTLALNSEVATRGQEIFMTMDTAGGTVAAGKCNACHFNAGANSAASGGTVNDNFDTGVEDIPDQPADLIDPANNPPDGGFGNSLNPEGSFGDGTFNSVSLVEAADTGPFFHNNSVETIEGAVAFYNSTAFANSPSGQFLASTDTGGIGIALEATQVVAVAAFLRVINVLENIRGACEMIAFVQNVVDLAAARSLIRLAIADVLDAIEVLDGGGLHPETQHLLREALGRLDLAESETDPTARNAFLTQALEILELARRELRGVGPAGSCSVDTDFESGTGDWINDSVATCATGAFELGMPNPVVNGGVTTQVDGDHTTGDGNSFFTAFNEAAGSHDVDSGVCIARSPVYPVAEHSEVSIWYFHGQRDTGGDPGGDFFLLEISLDGGTNFAPLVEIGDVTTHAVWTELTTTVPAGSQVVIRVHASDGPLSGDLVEAGIDDLTICPIG